MIGVHSGVSCNVHLGLPCRKNYEGSKVHGCVSMIYVHVHVDRCIYTLVNVYVAVPVFADVGTDDEYLHIV